MEHIIQFGVTVDDEEIKRRITDQASKTVVNEVKRELGVDRGYFNDNKLKSMINARVDTLFYENKDIIIQETAKILADKLARTKAVREARDKVINDVLGGKSNGDN